MSSPRLSATHKALLAEIESAGEAGLELLANQVSAASLLRHGLVTREHVATLPAARYYEGQDVPRNWLFTIRGRARTITIYRYKLSHQGKAVSEGRPDTVARNPKRNKGAADDYEALDEYVRSHWGHEGKAQVRSVQIASFDHGTLVELGELWEVAYGTTKGARGKRALYVHEFARARPVLAYHHCSRAKCPERGRLAIVGGTYRVEPRGIVG